jgi:hypothetical protein
MRMHTRPYYAQKTSRFLLCGGVLKLLKSPGGGHFLILFGHIMLWVTQVYKQFRQTIRSSRLLVVESIIQKEGNVVNLLARWIASM